MNTKRNNIDFFLANKNLSNTFSEIIEQINNHNLNHLNFRIVDSLGESKLGLISVIDSNSLIKFEKNNLKKNNHFIIIGEISNSKKNELFKDKINFEQILLPIDIISFFKKIISIVDHNIEISSKVFVFKKFKYSFHLNTIYVKDKSLYLTDKENEIFQTLIFNIKKPLDKKKLLLKVWNYEDVIDTHTLETHIYTLRKKIDNELDIKNLIEHKDAGYFINESFL